MNNLLNLKRNLSKYAVLLLYCFAIYRYTDCMENKTLSTDTITSILNQVSPEYKDKLLKKLKSNYRYNPQLDRHIKFLKIKRPNVFSAVYDGFGFINSFGAHQNLIKAQGTSGTFISSGPNEKGLAIVNNVLVDLSLEEQSPFVQFIPNWIVPIQSKLDKDSQYTLHADKELIIESKIDIEKALAKKCHGIDLAIYHTLITSKQKQGCWYKYQELTRKNSFYSGFNVLENTQGLAVQFGHMNDLFIGGNYNGKKLIQKMNYTTGTLIQTIDLDVVFQLYKKELDSFSFYYSSKYPNFLFINGFIANATKRSMLVLYDLINNTHALLKVKKGLVSILPYDKTTIDLKQKKLPSDKASYSVVDIQNFQ